MVRERYPDGILWTTMGEEIEAAGRLARVRDLIRWWTEKDPPTFETVSAASAHLRQELNGKLVLLVVDDVWHPEDVTPFQGLGPRAGLLVTTRDSRTLPAESVPVHVDAMEVSEAVRLLGTGLPSGAEAELKTLAARVGEWPLLLKIVNRQLRELVQDDGLSLEQALWEVNEALNAEGLTVFDREDLESRRQAVALTVGASLRRLSGEEVIRFEQLAIFPEDKDIPLRVLEKLWGLGSVAVKKLCGRLHDLSLLLRFDRLPGTIRLHDVIRAYLLKKGESHVAEWHRHLLDVYRPANGRWPDLPSEESYLWHHLIHHLVGAGQSDVCRSLLLDFHYLSVKLRATDTNALLADYSGFVEKDEEIRLVRDALRLSAHVLIREPGLIREQLWGRLLGRQEGRIHRLLVAGVSESCNPRIWLRPREATLNKPGGPLFRTIVHPDVVLSIAVLSEGQFISVAGENLRVWNVESGAVVKLMAQSTYIHALTLLSDRQVVAGAKDGLLRIFDIANGSLVHSISAHSAGVNAIACRGSEIISGSDDGTVGVWDVKSGGCLNVFRQSARANAILFLDKVRAVSGAVDGISILDLRDGRSVRLEGYYAGVNALTLIDEAVIVSGSNDGALRVIDLNVGKIRSTLRRSPGRVTRLGVLGSYRIIAGYSDGMLRVWDVESGELLREIRGHSSWVSALAVSDNGRVFSGTDGELRVWDLGDQVDPIVEGHSGRVTSLVALGSDSCASASEDKVLRIWDTNRGRSICALKGHAAGVYALGVLGGNQLVSVSSDGTLRVWDYEAGETLKNLQGRFGLLLTLGVVDPRQVVLGGDKLLLVEIETGNVFRIFEGHCGFITSVVVLDSRRMVSASFDETLRLWDLHSGIELGLFVGHTGPVNALAVLPDGRILSGSHDGTLRVWAVESGRVLQTLVGHSDRVTCVALMGDQYIVSGSEDGYLHVWELQSGRILCSFALDAPVAALTVIASSQTIIAGDASGRVHFFDLVKLGC